MKTRARIEIREELSSEIAGGVSSSVRAVIVNGEIQNIRLQIGDSGLRFQSELHLADARDAIGRLLEAICKARARFDWENTAYIEEDGVRVV